MGYNIVNILNIKPSVRLVWLMIGSKVTCQMSLMGRVFLLSLSCRLINKLMFHEVLFCCWRSSVKDFSRPSNWCWPLSFFCSVFEKVRTVKDFLFLFSRTEGYDGSHDFSRVCCGVFVFWTAVFSSVWQKTSDWLSEGSVWARDGEKHSHPERESVRKFSGFRGRAEEVGRA